MSCGVGGSKKLLNQLMWKEKPIESRAIRSVMCVSKGQDLSYHTQQGACDNAIMLQL